MRHLLLVVCCLCSHTVFAQAAKLQVLKLNDATLFEKLTTGLAAQQLLRGYRPNLKLLQVRPNRHEPAVTDSLLQVKTPADNLTLFKNRYTVLLRGAAITSTKVTFAGMRVGVTQEAFCRTLHIKPGYDQYVFTDGLENFVQLTFSFGGDKLQRVDYKEVVTMDAID
jgi:hypothetical protein